MVQARGGGPVHSRVDGPFGCMPVQSGCGAVAARKNCGDSPVTGFRQRQLWKGELCDGAYLTAPRDGVAPEPCWHQRAHVAPAAKASWAAAVRAHRPEPPSWKRCDDRFNRRSHVQVAGLELKAKVGGRLESLQGFKPNRGAASVGTNASVSESESNFDSADTHALIDSDTRIIPEAAHSLLHPVEKTLRQILPHAIANITLVHVVINVHNITPVSLRAVGLPRRCRPHPPVHPPSAHLTDANPF